METQSNKINLLCFIVAGGWSLDFYHQRKIAKNQAICRTFDKTKKGEKL